MAHVVFFLHGFQGHPREFNLMVRSFTEKLGQRVVLHVLRSYHGHTHISGAKAAQRVMEEMQTVVARTNCDRLSTVCHSFGGVVMAWALHLLDRAGGLASNLRLVNFIALASPFAGIRGSAYGLKLGGVIKRFSAATREMCLEDAFNDGTSDAESRSPFLSRVAQPDVLSVLGRFDRRAVYANLHGDLQVGYESAALVPCKPPHALVRSDDWPHISAESAHGGRDHTPGSAFGAGDESPWLRRDPKRELILELMRTYCTLGWERVDCCFGPAYLPSPLAHEQIIGKVLGGLLEDSRASDVVVHLISRFACGDGGEGGVAAVAIT